MNPQMNLLEPLTEREDEILKLMAEGLTNREISDQLVIEFETVRWHTKNIYNKLGVHTRAQAVIRAGLLHESGPAAPAVPVRPPVHNLPTYSTSFLGRDDELDEMIALLRDPNVRLVTIAGQGGMGKTRLSVEAARAILSDFPDGVFFVPLSTLDSPDEIVPAIARTLNLHLKAGDEWEQVLRHLSGKTLLLILDNFERLRDGAAVVDDLIHANRTVKLLVTSHSALNLSEEWIRHLEGIPYPTGEQVEDVEQYGAVQLCLDRVQRVRGDFSLAHNQACIVELCRLLYGMPLAIELAATWLKVMPCSEVVQEIRQNVDFLVTRQRDVDLRHQSIRAVFDYSWHLLTEEERRVFRRLSVFRGGFGRAAAEQVAGASIQILAELVDKSFLYENDAGMYEAHDLLRQYAEKQLESLSSTHMSTQSKMIYALASLVKGNFEIVGNMADNIIDNTSVVPNRAEQAFGMALLSVIGGVQEDYARCLQLAEASASLIRNDPTIREPITSIFVHLGLAIGYCGVGDYQAARRSLKPTLESAQALRGPAFATLCLPVMAVIRAHEAEPEEALSLLALAFTHPASTPTWLEKWPLLIDLQAELQAELGPETYARVWREGKELSLDMVTDDFMREYRQ